MRLVGAVGFAAASVVIVVAAAPAVVSGSTNAATAAVPCRVTLPTEVKPGTAFPTAFNFGNNDLRAVLWPHGHLIAGRLPDGGSMATIRPDGSIDAKQGWWRALSGTLIISGRRLDAAAPPLRAWVPSGYGPTGFQPAGLTFPTVGCWQVVGKIGRAASLTFVVAVSKVKPVFACHLTPVSKRPPNAYMGGLSTHWLRQGTLWMGYTRGDHAFVADPRGQKIAWYREMSGRLHVSGTRLDASAPPLKADIPNGYGLSGFQASGLTFSSAGCWKVVAHVGQNHVSTFIIHVARR